MQGTRRRKKISMGIKGGKMKREINEKVQRANSDKEQRGKYANSIN